MKSLVEIKYDKFYDKIYVEESFKLLDKNEYYEAKFRYSNGYIRTEPFIRKDEIGIPQFPYCSINEKILYVNGTKYHEDPEYWQTLIKEHDYFKNKK